MSAGDQSGDVVIGDKHHKQDQEAHADLLPEQSLLEWNRATSDALNAEENQMATVENRHW